MQSFSVFLSLASQPAGAQVLLKRCSRSILFPSLPSGPPWEKCARLMKKHRHVFQKVIQKCFSFAEFHNSREFCIRYINRESYETPETCQNQEVVYHHLQQQKTTLNTIIQPSHHAPVNQNSASHNKGKNLYCTF